MKVICFIIHGIGEQDQGFSLPLKEGIQKQLTKLKDGSSAVTKVEFHNLMWAEEGSDAQDNLYRNIYPDNYVTGGAIRSSLQFIHNLGSLRALTFRLIGDVFKYLGKFQKPVKESVLLQVAKVLKEKQQSKEAITLVLIGHSLGTVILNDLITGFLEYKYAAFDRLIGSTSVFTMGSPISLFSLVADTVEPNRFRSWTNFLHPRDPIAFPLASQASTVKNVELSGLIYNPLKCHGIYWKHPEVHKQIATEIHSHINMVPGVVLQTGDIRNEAPPEIYQPFQTTSTNVGFSQYLPNFQKVPFEDLFSTKSQIDVCLLYGGTWGRTNAPYIVSALEKAATNMRICLLSPDSASVDGINYQFNMQDKDEIRDRIKRASQKLIEAFQNAAQKSASPGRLRIYHSLNGVTHSFYRFDDLIYFAPRQMTTNDLAATPIPTLVFRGKYPPQKKDETGYDMYSWLMRDFDLLLDNPREAVLIFDSQKP